MKTLIKYLNILYPNNYNDTYKEITKLINKYKHPKIEKNISNQNTILITYGDSLIDKNKYPLETIHSFLKNECKNIIKDIHLLPIYPFSSDDGFSVIDYLKIRKDLGNWKHISKLSKNYNVMLDGVINHISSQSKWFKNYLNDNPKYHNYFISKNQIQDTTKVIRPRTSSLFTKINNKEVWTTFSSDQIDLNFSNPKVLLEIIKTILFYDSFNIRYLRLDAIGFIWKESNTSCMHLNQTHIIIKLIKYILKSINSNCLLVTETNVAHKENISYFGNNDEADMVYNFTLPPLIALSYIKEDVSLLNNYLTNLEYFNNKYYFNFLASHDGIGLRGLEGIASNNDMELLLDKTLSQKGNISYRLKDNIQIPYELNINYFSLLFNNDYSNELNAKKFISTYALILSLKGIPGIYIHSLLGSLNDNNLVEKTNRARSINRAQINYSNLKEELKDSNNLRYIVFYKLLKLIELRNKYSQFNPDSNQTIINEKDFIHIIREDIHIFINIKNKQISINNVTGYDLINNKTINTNKLNPFDILWIKVGG